VKNALLALALLGAPLASAQEAASLAEYREALARIESAWDAGQQDTAQATAAALLGARITSDRDAFQADVSLLGPISRGETGVLLRSQLRALREALAAEAAARQPTTAPDHGLLERLHRRQQGPRVEKAGEVSIGVLKPLSLPERALQALEAVLQQLADWFGRLLDWLARLRPRSRSSGAGVDAGGATLAVVALLAAVLGLLAWRALVRRRGAPSDRSESSTAVDSSPRDEDPLSREANEWERYAVELEASGRRREAIRAWYHSVLVACFRNGLLHYEKGRTNWEYVARLPPEAPFRPSFVDVTRRFDREWYGRESSEAEALREQATQARALLRLIRQAAA
jgi:hypothetical protein